MERVVLFGRTMRSQIRFVWIVGLLSLYWVLRGCGGDGNRVIPVICHRINNYVTLKVVWCGDDSCIYSLFDCFDCHFIGAFVSGSVNVFVWYYAVFLISGSGRRCSTDPLRGPMKRRPSYKWSPFCDILSCVFVTQRFYLIFDCGCIYGVYGQNTAISPSKKLWWIKWIIWDLPIWFSGDSMIHVIMLLQLVWSMSLCFFNW